ncbi:hypothetical protein [Bacillus pseudomycoides]|uniref:Uncharacterized protein n=1 Tax=Bacillus pseudomycoides TaxID=64104 RepID=A0A2B6JDB2_9BACI|nr:hypothetical protein [Bacillus pseudomycoides]PDY44941.1 hypothetical protein CON79_22875 [Bacillus pseudomycoides]PEA80933.1 hypothetical protein CON99_25425 [Bacillus pseudomycoides]PED05370.1 hypothetical protein COO19_26915 [Bacillus pseudomycoides]PED69823.1 hypothetical protein CON97_22915 [Bacillus pseudomycoides]PEI34166.1 hypothetical protein CN620_26545 [Bacillus pseudomycoides]
MFKKFKFYLISIVVSSILGGIIIGANFLFQNIYGLIAGKGFYFNMWPSVIIFCIVFISSFAYMLRQGPDILIND